MPPFFFGLFVNNMKISLISAHILRGGVKPVLLVLAASLAAGLSHAGPEDSLNFAVGTTLRHDDNFFRQPSGSPAPNAGSGNSSSKSDTISTLYAGVRVDKLYSLQRFQLDVTATQYKYRNNDYLDFTAVDYRGAWLWSVSPRLTGILSADKTSELTSYADLQNTTVKNRRTVENQRFTADWWVDGGWHLIGGGYRQRSKGNNNELSAFGDYEESTGELGVRYVAANENSIAAIIRETDGEYLDSTLNAVSLLDTHYRQSESQVRGILRLTGNSLLDGRIGFVDRTYDHFSQRNYSGIVGELNYRWTPTGKLRLAMTGGRNLVAYQESNNSYYASQYVNLTPEWLVTEKTTIRLGLGVAQNDYRGAVVPVTTMREDTVRTFQVGANWRPTPTITVDGYLTHEQRSSNLPSGDYDANVAGVSASLLF
jgi:exopolysaccharide biosynthesis operon protein EpsL